jgi:integrase
LSTPRERAARWPLGSPCCESARTYQPKREDLALSFSYPRLATFLLTGGRRAEVLGLEVSDVGFDRKTVTFRPSMWRRLKTASSFRTVPLWPQLEEILRPYVFDRPPSRLLFPSYVARHEAMVSDFRKPFDVIAARAGWKPGEITPKQFRHTYTAARLQTLDQGAPVSVYTMAKELGHGGESMVRRVYGHLGTVRHRSEVVEYRVEQHEALVERLAARRG